MKIWSITRTRNDGDVLEAFVRHHSAFLDRMIIVDHLSQDNSREILDQLKGEGLPIEIRHDDGIPHAHGRVMTTIARELMKLPDTPDVLVLLDTDEFIVREGGSSPRTELEKIDTTLHIPCRNYVPLAGDPENELNVLKKITHRRSAENPQWYKVFMHRRALMEHPEASIMEGNHALVNELGRDVLPRTISQTLSIAHFPVRSGNQILTKVFGGWLSHLADPAPVHGAMYQWKAILDDFRKRHLLKQEELTKIALEYATKTQWERLPVEFTGRTKPASAETSFNPQPLLAPVPATFTIRYQHHPVDHFSVLVSSAEKLAEEHAKILKELREKKS